MKSLYLVKRAIGLGVLTYVFSFIPGVIISLLVGVDFESAQDLPDRVYLWGMLVSAVLMVFMTLWYFANKQLKQTARSGFYFGFTAIGVGFVFDTLMFLPMILSGGTDPVLIYYANELFWLTVVVVILVATFVGWLGERK